jgi:DNA-binding response OmpR family regulator
VARRDRVVPKEELIEVVWPGLVVEDNNLQVQISALRKVLGAQAIATVPGRGYQFTVAAAAAPSTSARGRRGEGPARGARRPRRLPTRRAPSRRRRQQGQPPPALPFAGADGHTVASADNGRAALEKLRSEPFDLLLLDLEMPEMDGFRPARAARRRPGAARRAGDRHQLARRRGRRSRAASSSAPTTILHKPVNPVLLKARVDSSLERKHLRDRAARAARPLAPGAVGEARRPAPRPAGGPRPRSWSPACASSTPSAARQPAQETLELLGSWTTLMLDAVESQAAPSCRSPATRSAPRSVRRCLQRAAWRRERRCGRRGRWAS